MAKLLILYTGGTIGMRTASPSDPSSPLVPQDLNQLRQQLPKAYDAAHQLDFMSLPQALDSSDIKPPDWQQMAKLLAKAYGHYEGFVVLHGTDTLAYSATALSFMLENLHKPVVFTGSQLPLGFDNSDAATNFNAALEVAALGAALPEVVIVFAGNIWRACRTRKQHTHAFDAFGSPNTPALGQITDGVDLQQATIQPGADFCLRPSLKSHVLHLALTPGLSNAAWQHLFKMPDLDGVLIQSYGAGNAPMQPVFLACLHEAIIAGIPVVNASQCPHGHVDMHTYATGRQLADIGVLSAFDMTYEAALIKLMWLSAQPHLSLAAWSDNLRGELSQT